MKGIGGTDLRRMAWLVLHGVFWGAVCGGAGGIAVGTVFLPIIGSAIGGILGSVVGLCLGALCGVVLAAFFGVHVWLGHDRVAAAGDIPALAVIIVAVAAAVVVLDRDSFGITGPVVVLASLTALPSAWFVARQLSRHMAGEIALEQARDSLGAGTAAGDPHRPA